MKKTTLLAAAGVLASLSAVRADEPAAKSSPPALTAADKQKSEGEYIFPSPGDLLGALHRTTQIDWKALATQIEQSGAAGKTTYSEDSLKALNLGMRVADAFVAIEAKDKGDFLKFSGAVETLATQLSASSTLTANRDKARKLADEGKWPELGNLLESIRFDVLRDFKAVPDEDSIILANLGGWLRGLDLVTGALDTTYTADGTKVLRQAGLVEYLTARLQKLGAPANTDKTVALIRSKLPEIAALCTFDEKGTLPQDKVKKLHEITTALVQAIQK